MERREFLKTVTTASALLMTGAQCRKTPALKPGDDKRWRGFNLLEKFTDKINAPYRETDFAWMAEWGFNFVRLPMSYWCWSDVNDWTKFDEKVLKEIDQAVEFGRQYNIHVNLNFHRAPGYCVNTPREPVSLWENEKALEATCLHWECFTKRYKGISSERLSFDLLNEPSDIPEQVYVRVVQAMVGAIRRYDAERLIFADGLRWGRTPVFGLKDLNIAQSTRGYDPMQVSHYKADWIGESGLWPNPSWPLNSDEHIVWNKDMLHKEVIAPWLELEKQGVMVHVGEWGCYNQTPHKTALAWMKDYLSLWKEVGWGWALWNFRGAFGILNSNRADVKYEIFNGQKLDRKMLELLQSF
ncbi:MAG TPA: cellulase family glycosylhydrolase [bacterium]|nr:cellulase family glycosylhydrolase [bacterium]HPN42689.1 cellulase family glycosylhydrolase [bacterium]